MFPMMWIQLPCMNIDAIVIVGIDSCPTAGPTHGPSTAHG
jgi:hypothetical protein